MIDWIARANAKLAKTRGTAAAKTDESRVSAVPSGGGPRVSDESVRRFGSFGSGSAEAASRNDGCTGWPLDEDSGAPFAPWGPYVTPAMLDGWRHTLRELVAELATLEEWSDAQRERITHFVEHQPALATLRDDIFYFTQRLSEARRGVERPKGWACEGLADRQYCSGCNGECIGTRRSCTSCRARGRSAATKAAAQRGKS